MPAKNSRDTPKPKSPPKPHRTKGSKSAAAIATDRAGVSRRKAAASAEQRAHRASAARLGAEKKAASRLAFKAARERLGEAPKPGPSPIDQQSFDQLKRGWFSALNYLARFEPLDPTAPDVTAARRRLEEIELEWERRSHLRADDPEYFEWPSTAAPKGAGEVGVTDWEEIGMLGYLGYHVGRTSELTAQHRRALLSRIFSMRLPPLNSFDYMAQWGLPKSSSRLKKMAETLASLARNAKRRRHNRLAVAVAHWEHDLAYLRETIYVGRFNFGWPQV